MFVRLSLYCSALLILSPVAALTAQEKPAQDKSLAAPLSELEQKIETALAKKVKWNYPGTRLGELVADLSKQTGLPISLDPEGLEEAGVTPQTPITLDLGELSLRQGLRLLEAWHLSYMPSASGLAITSEEIAAERAVTRIYPVRDMIHHVDKRFGAIDDYDSLIDLITSHLSPDSWVDNGGSGTIRGFAGCLVITFPLDQHHQIAALLAMLRKAKHDPASTATLISGDKKRIAAALDKRDSGSIDMSLSRYALDLAKKTGFPVHVDPEGLEEAGVTLEQVLQAEYHDARIGDVAREILARFHLAWVAFEEYIVITSEEKAFEIARATHVYPIGDLIEDEVDTWNDTESLVYMVQDAAGADHWIDNGGQSSISVCANPPVLVVTTTDEIHDSVEATLTKIRAAGAANYVKESAKTANRIVERVYPLYAARRELRAKIELGKQEAEKPQENMPGPTPNVPSVGDAKPMPQFGGFLGFPRHQVAEPIPSAEDVAKLIEELLPDPSWKTEGVVLKPFHDVLIIRQSPAMLRKVEDLLRKIGAWQPAHQLDAGFHGGSIGGGGFGGGRGGGGFF